MNFIVLRPHPYYKKATLNHFKKKFKFKFNLMENFSPRQIIKSSDFVLAGDSSLCYESIILGKKILLDYIMKSIILCSILKMR